MQEKAREQRLLPRSTRKQRPPVAVRLEGAKNPKFHRSIVQEGEARPYHRWRRLDAFLRYLDLLGFYRTPTANNDDRAVTITTSRPTDYPERSSRC
jgi:hypothetical protein